MLQIIFQQKTSLEKGGLALFTRYDMPFNIFCSHAYEDFKNKYDSEVCDQIYMACLFLGK
jgi:hypothetical protein